MAIQEILKFPHPVLKEKARKILKIDDSIRKLVKDMAETMYAAPGIGLAANQVGHPLRLVVLDVTRTDESHNFMVLINPEIVSTEGECTWDEGCLSLPEFNEKIKRKEKVVVRCLNLEGKAVEIEGADLLAIALQHEIDHLDGVLIFDRVSRLKRELFKRKLRKEKEADQGKTS
jgi:peptide deformylase